MLLFPETLIQDKDLPTYGEVSLGEMERKKVNESMLALAKKRSYGLFTENERYLIGKYASVHGATKAVRHFQKTHPHLKFPESTARSLRAKYESNLKEQSSSMQLQKKKLGRPLLLGDEIDTKVQEYLNMSRKKGAIVNSVVAIATAKALIEQSSEEHPKSISLENTEWARSLFRRMGFVRRAATTGRPKMPDGAVKEAGFIFHHSIIQTVERYQIPPSLIMNFDQTPLKYAPVSSQTLAKKNVKTVAISGLSYRQGLTATFGVTFSNQFLPMQLVYGGKTEASYPKVKFSSSFSLSANPKHFSNTAELLKLINEVIVPYVDEQRKTLGDANQAALLIIDVFRGQMTDPVLEALKENKIILVKIPPNMTHIYQPLDLTVNRSTKAFFKRKFTEWYSQEIHKQLEEGKKIDQVDVVLRLSVLKPLHAKWIIEFYNDMTSGKGKDVIANGWKSAGMMEALKSGQNGIGNLDPFGDIDPLMERVSLSSDDVLVSSAEIKENGYERVERENDDEDDEIWDDLNGDFPGKNIFDILDDELDD